MHLHAQTGPFFALVEAPLLQSDQVAGRIVDGVLARAVVGPGLFRTEEARLS